VWVDSCPFANSSISNTCSGEDVRFSISQVSGVDGVKTWNPEILAGWGAGPMGRMSSFQVSSFSGGSGGENLALMRHTRRPGAGVTYMTKGLCQ
jgi:hypothetical protein